MAWGLETPCLWHTNTTEINCMKRNNKYGLAGLMLAAGILGASAASADAGVAYVTNQDGGVSVIDLATMETKNTIDVEATDDRAASAAFFTRLMSSCSS